MLVNIKYRGGHFSLITVQIQLSKEKFAVEEDLSLSQIDFGFLGYEATLAHYREFFQLLMLLLYALLCCLDK